MSVYILQHDLRKCRFVQRINKTERSIFFAIIFERPNSFKADNVFYIGKIGTRKNMWLAIILVEALYVLVSRTIIHFCGVYNFEAEAYLGVSRIVMFAVTLLIFKDFIFRDKPEYKAVVSPLWIFAVLLFLSIPFLEGHMGGLGFGFKLFFSATSIFVALHEEIVYRGVVQRLLLERFSIAKAVLITSSVFTVYHIGAIDFYINLYIQIFLASIILGIIYIKTNSLTIVVALHTIYDALSPFTPLSEKGPIITYQEATYIMLVSLGFVLVWFYRIRRF